MKKAIKCGKLFHSTDGTVGENQVVLIEGERIQEVLDAASFREEGCEVIDLSDKFVMPGLIDCHVHISEFGRPKHSGLTPPSRGGMPW